MSRELEVLESPVAQRVGERIAYTLDTTPYGGSPSAVVCELRDLHAGADAPGLLDGAHGIAGSVVTTPRVVGLVAGRTYRLTVQFETGGQRYRPYVDIKAVE